MWLSDDCCYDLTISAVLTSLGSQRLATLPEGESKDSVRAAKGKTSYAPHSSKALLCPPSPRGGRLKIREGFAFLPKKIKVAGFFQAEQMPQLRRLCVFFGAGSNFFVKNAANTRDMT